MKEQKRERIKRNFSFQENLIRKQILRPFRTGTGPYSFSKPEI
jgi:hypothetical protein